MPKLIFTIVLLLLIRLPYAQTLFETGASIPENEYTINDFSAGTVENRERYPEASPMHHIPGINNTDRSAFKPLAPANDEPCGAILLPINSACNYRTFDNASATSTAGVPAPGCGNYQGADIW